MLCIPIRVLNILDGQPERKLCIPGVTQLGYAGDMTELGARVRIISSACT